VVVVVVWHSERQKRASLDSITSVKRQMKCCTTTMVVL
jgi:hypothetical protein